jgi:hypothetical protein
MSLEPGGLDPSPGGVPEEPTVAQLTNLDATVSASGQDRSASTVIGPYHLLQKTAAMTSGRAKSWTKPRATSIAGPAKDPVLQARMTRGDAFWAMTIPTPPRPTTWQKSRHSKESATMPSPTWSSPSRITPYGMSRRVSRRTTISNRCMETRAARRWLRKSSPLWLATAK